jgi:hypothetical protein
MEGQFTGYAPIEVPERYYEIKDLAHRVGRNPELIRQWVQAGRVPSIQDPERKNGRLIPESAIPAILRMREVGSEWREVTYTRPDGTTFTRVVHVKREVR